MTTQQFEEPVDGAVDPAAGQRAKTTGMAAADAATPVSWQAACDAAIREMARRGEVFQASDLVREGLVDEPPHPNQWGPRFGAAARAGVIRAAGVAQSRRATVHRSLCRTWIGTATARAAA
ncbi:hypothetical protein GCM10010406_21600 [Streptomyces thermolineatus]|uniref:Uncharacterized protein n=1 Tax=Streptomyces thermolineatus TaxID=44033 RepID=A0ABP5YPZ8_9ACTN